MTTFFIFNWSTEVVIMAVNCH